MTELLQFMYQGVVHVKHSELNSFMEIAQRLQIKGLATTPSNQPAHQTQTHHTQKSPASPVSNFSSKLTLDNYPHPFHSNPMIGQKRTALDFSGISSKKHMKRSSDSVDNDVSTESMDNPSSEDAFPFPQISMLEQERSGMANVKRELNDSISSPGSARNLSAAFNYSDFNSEYIRIY